ncbi:MAG: MFS transporter [Candidatus Bathyarchaeia archaeon]|nr:MFS transporter [Candidatus Bathyarchaeota archaeon]
MSGKSFSYKRLAVVGGLGSWSDAMDEMVIAITMPLLIAFWKISMPEVGFLISGIYLGMFVSAFISGPLIDYIGRKKGFVLGNFLAALAYLLYLVAPNFQWFYAARILSGFFACLSTVAFYTWLPEEVPPERRQTIVGRASAMSVIGTLNISIMLILAGIYGFTWHVFFAYVCIFDLVVAILGVLLLRESSLWQERQKLIAEGKVKREERVPLKKFLSPEVRAKFVLALLLSISGWFGLMFIVLPFLATFQSTVLAFSTALIGIVEVTCTINGVIARAVLGMVSDRVGRLNTLILCAVLCIIGGSLSWRTPSILGVGEKLPIIVFFAVTFWIYLWGLNGICDTSRTWYAELIPTSIRGSMESFMQILASLIAFFGTIIVGVIAGYVGLGEALAIMPLIAGIIIIIVSVIAKKLNLETKGKRLDI